MMPISRTIIVLVFLLSLSLSEASLSWSDCGVQLNKDIHYQSASISTSAVPGDPTLGLYNSSSPFSINVEATIVNTIYNAQTRLMVWKDGDTFLDVYIADLCTLIGTSKSLSCPIPVGQVSFTYSFDDTTLPYLISGEYLVQIRFISETAPTTELGCLQLSAPVDGLDGTGGLYTSGLSVALTGTVMYGVSDPTMRSLGDTIYVGPWGDSSYGQFYSGLVATNDLGGSISDLSNYVWTLNGTLQKITPVASSGDTIQTFLGTFSIGYLSSGTTAQTLFTGNFNWTQDINTARTPQIIFTGTFSLSPEYYYIPSFYNYPVVIGNLGTFTITQSGTVYKLTASRTWCTAGYDACNVCGGDGKSCLTHRTTTHKGWTDRGYAAVIIGTVGGFFSILAIIVLSRMIVKQKRARPHDDSDLIDHPQKPDYGTMAIDDIIREGERA